MIVHNEQITVYKYRHTHHKGQHPDTGTDGEGRSHAPVILAPDWLMYYQTAVQANGSKQEDTGKHVEDNDGWDKFAQEQSIGPVSSENQVSQGEGQGEAAEEIGQGEMEEPNCVHGRLHL